MSFPDFSCSDAKNHWERFCNLLWFDDSLGIWLDISRMNIKSSELNTLEEKYNKAFLSINDLENGSIANIDENRQVGHYWLRNPDIAPDKTTCDEIKSQIDKIELFGRDILSGKILTPEGERFTDVLWIGIGGSGLGPLLIIKSLQKTSFGLKFHFIDNVDHSGFNKTLDEIGDKLSTTLFVTVSKSGGTPEPRISMEKARMNLEAIGLNWPSRSIAITMLNSKLGTLASDENWLNVFDLPDWVGGRTSITSAVGLLPIALIGLDIRDFLNGASLMDAKTRLHNVLDNPAALLSAAWYLSSNGKGSRDMVILPYSDSLELFSRYMQQLVMESLGKKVSRNGDVVCQGISVFGNKGSTDQHAYVQQLRDGIDNFFATFIEVLADSNNSDYDKVSSDYLSGFLQGTRSALTAGSRQSITITMRTIEEKTMGALIALYERSVGLYAELVNINAYDQPGVEAGKKAASKILELQSKIESVISTTNSIDLEGIQKLTNEETPEQIFWILRHLLSNNNNNYIVDGDWGEPNSIRISKNNQTT